MSVSSLTVCRHYNDHFARAGQVLQELNALMGRVQGHLNGITVQRAQAVTALAQAYLPELEKDALARSEQLTGFRGFSRRDPLAALAKELLSLQKRVVRIEGDERFRRRTFLVGPHGELTRELAERQSLLQPWADECKKYEDLPDFMELVTARYDTPEYDQGFFSARYWKLWSAGDRVCDALGVGDFGDDVLPAYAKVAAERLKWVRQVDEIQDRVNEVHSLVQQRDEAVALQPRLPGKLLAQCIEALGQHLEHADTGLLQTWLGDEPDRALLIALRRAAGLAAKAEFLAELASGLQAQIAAVQQRRAKYQRKSEKFSRSKYVGQMWGENHLDQKFEAKAAKMHQNLGKTEALVERLAAYEQYERFDLENDPELWWVEFTRKRPTRLTPRLRTWYDRNPGRAPELDGEDEAARAVAAAVVAQNDDELGYIS
jgi:hypothetical protein